MFGRISLAGFSAPLLLAAACSPGPGPAATAIDEFVRAVQSEDLGRLYCLVAGASEAAEAAGSGADRARAEFEAWARARYEDYDRGRDAGWVELDEQGLVLVKLLALGRGTFYSRVGTRSDGSDVRVIETEIRLGYAHIDLSRFTPGTTLYVAGLPVGRVHAVRVPAGTEEATVDALDRVRVRWTLARGPAAGGCPGGWTVATAVPVEGSSSSSSVTWVF